MTGPRAYKSGRMRATVNGVKVTLQTDTHELTVTADGRTDRERIEHALSNAWRHRKVFTRASRTRCHILQLRDESGRPV